MLAAIHAKRRATAHVALNLPLSGHTAIAFIAILLRLPEGAATAGMKTEHDISRTWMLTWWFYFSCIASIQRMVSRMFSVRRAHPPQHNHKRWIGLRRKGQRFTVTSLLIR